jgi:hypothetical protein
MFVLTVFIGKKKVDWFILLPQLSVFCALCTMVK